MQAKRAAVVLCLLTALAAALRFSTLDLQSYWLDEIYTVETVRGGFGAMLSAIPRTESTPPLYYVVAWVWAHVFGAGEAGLRSLSAVAGTAFVPVAYGAAATLTTRRVGLVAATLAATSPILVWYSQEARSYEMLVLLSGLSLWWFARVIRRRGGPADLVGFAAFSAAAVATHYFAVFLVLPEAVWLIAVCRGRARAGAIAAAAAIAAVCGALAPLAIDQARNEGAAFIDDSPLPARALQAPKQFLVGFDLPLEGALTAIAIALALLGVALLVWRGSQVERRGAAAAAGVAIASIGLPVLVAAAGADYVLGRNLLASWLPCAVVVAAGLGARAAGRVGVAGAASIGALGCAIVSMVATEPNLRRDDWRGVAEAIGPPRANRAIVAPNGGAVPLAFYEPGLVTLPAEGMDVTEVVQVVWIPRSQHPERPPDAPQFPQPPQFPRAVVIKGSNFTVFRFTSPAPRRATPAELLKDGLPGPTPATYYQAALPEAR